MKTLTELINQKEVLKWLSGYFYKIYGTYIAFDISKDTKHYEIKYESKIFARVSILDKSVNLKNTEITSYDVSRFNLKHVKKLFCFKGKNDLASIDQDGILNINYDCVAFIVCLLSRIEEYESDQLDIHQRFISVNSWSEKFGFTLIPVVDHWADFLMYFLSANINKDVKPVNNYAVHISHDVDVPYNFYKEAKVKRFIRSFLGSIYRREFERAYEVAKSLFIGSDVYDRFDFLMNISDKVNEKSTFNFIPQTTSKRWDADYRLDDIRIISLIQKITSRGHNIGLHCSYNSNSINNQITLEKEYLQSICEENGYQQNIKSSRMHYLRWSTWQTARKLARSGIKLDTTLGFAEKVGFRCGTARGYSPYDFETNQEIQIEILPMHMMDVTLWGYMKIRTKSDMLVLAKEIIDRVKEVNGTFNILWHNSDLVEKWKRELYQEIIFYSKK